MDTSEVVMSDPAEPGNSQRPDHGRLAGMIRRRPILAFLAWFFTVGQAFAFAPMYVDTPMPDQWFIIGSTLIGLLLPALVITRIVDGPEGLAAMGRRILEIRAPIRIYLVGVALMPLMALGLAVAILGPPEVSSSTVVTSLGSGLVLGLLINFFLNNLWEEVAWMGFVQARLQDRHGAMRAALITAPLFALQHVALLIDNDPATLVLIMVAFTVVIIPYRAFNGWLYNRTGGSLFIVGLVHALSNAVGPGSGLTDGYLRVLYPSDGELVGLLHIVALALMGLAVMAATRLRLASSERQPDPRLEPSVATGSAA